MSNIGLKFFKTSFDNSNENLKSKGALVFDTSAQAIYVGGELATSSVKDASFLNKVLTITKTDDSSIVLDFRDVASAEGVNSLLSTLRDDINGVSADVVNLQTATGVPDGSTAPDYSDASILVTATTMVDADKILAKAIYDLSAGVEGLDVPGYVQGELPTASNGIKIYGIKEENGKISHDSTKDVEIAVDGTYDATNNKIATKSTVTSAIADVSMASHTVGAANTIGTISQTNGVITVTDTSIAIDHTQVTDWDFHVGVTEVAEGTTNGTVSVTTNGTTADVSVHGLGSAAYTDSSEYATAEQGEKADTALQEISVKTDTFINLSVGAKENNTQELGATVKTDDVSTATEDASGLATAYAVRTYVDNKTADLSGAMHFRSVINTEGSTAIAQINNYYTTSDKTPEVGDVFVDSARGEEWVVKSLPSSGTTLAADNIEMFGTVDPKTVVTSVKASTSTTGLVVTPTTSTPGDVTVTVNTSDNYQIPTTVQMEKVDSIAVDTSAKSVTDGTNTLSDLVSDANYAHITVTSTSVSDGTATFEKYVHPTTTAVSAAAVKVGKDDLGHVVFGTALDASDIAVKNADVSANTVNAAISEIVDKIADANITIDGHVGAITTGDGLTDVAGDSGSFGIKLNDSSLNGLSVDASGLGLNLVSDTSNGAMSATEHVKLTGIEAGAQVNKIETVKVNGAALEIDASKAVDVSAITGIVDSTDGSYVTVTVTTTDGVATVTSSTTIGDVSNGTEGLAEASDVQAYVDRKAGEAAAVVDMSTAIQVNDGSTVIATVGGQNISAEVQFNWEVYE